MGTKGEDFDIELVRQARAGLGESPALMVDAGIAWHDDHETALRRAEAFAAFDLTWLEEPLAPEAVEAYGELSRRSPTPIAAGEGCDTVRAATDLVEHGRLHCLQIDPGRVGGITPSMETVKLARRRGAVWVNHTYKSHISLAVAMTVFAGEQDWPWLEYCESGSPLIDALVGTPLTMDAEGYVSLPARPGLGIDGTWRMRSSLSAASRSTSTGAASVRQGRCELNRRA
jgi:L-rhamnonate dehydratase